MKVSMVNQLPIAYFSEPIKSISQTKIDDYLSTDLQEIIFKYGVIAGGFAVYLLTDIPCNDIDIFVLNGNHACLEELLQKLNAYFLQLKVTNSKETDQLTIKHYKSVISIHHPSLKCPLQIIFTDKSSLQNLLIAFDMDYVQCGLECRDKQIILVQSTIARFAHNNKRVTYTSDYSIHRFQKAAKKGFSLPLGVDLNKELISKITVDYYKNYTSLEPIFQQIKSIPVFNRRTYSWLDSEAQEMPINYMPYRFIWILNLDAQEHFQFLVKTHDRCLHSDVDKLILRGAYQEAVILALYKRKKTQKNSKVIPSMILSANNKSLSEICRLISEILH